MSRAHRVIGWDKKEYLFNLDGTFLARKNIELLINLSVMADLQSSRFLVDTPCDEVNVGGARHIGKMLKGSGIAWIQMSTREVFGPVYTAKDVIKTKAGLRPKFLLAPEQPYAPRNSYGKSKVMAEFISESHPQSAVIRLSTCYMDYDQPGGNWVVSLIRAAVQGRPVTLTRGGEQFRDPLHTDDLAKLMLLIHEKKAFGDLDAKYWEKNLNTNLKSAYDLALSAAPLMKRKGGGRIVHVADWTAASGRPRYKHYLPYYVSKAGLLGLTEVLALELAPEILVNAIAPGPIMPPRRATKQERDEVEKSTPLRRWGHPEEIAKTVVFLAETDFVTGECIRVDGGRHLY